jgi:RNA polymerase sigma-54 factor
MQRLSQQQRLQQKLSPQQIQLMKLLQVPTANLEERIKEEIEENPALELGNEDNEDKSLEEKTVEEISSEFEQNENEDYINESEEHDEFDQIDISEYVKEGDDEDADYNFRVMLTKPMTTSPGINPVWRPRFMNISWLRPIC